ncbi:SCO3242 family prenyltransferase [Streptomyces sp. TRM70350]|uniref:SCO3242 family prenyltransferase n=1 Tax=Streptomyces sp. TRM70350 TaxID=2856165 RepID=UPI001C4433B6|nr:UbiA family prenyltransferase [Streptomyces sp. TRM70350]MBV7694234.1 UbiA family prenyltransferase [Streptomyces sp. TRM70350]
MSRSRAWAELLRLPALSTVPGDALSGAVATGARPNPRTVLAIGSSLCLYEAGMALNDWADREEDAAERPERPLPSGRIRPSSALTAACALTAAGLALAARAGRPALAVATPLAATVWAYDLALKHTPAGPVAMAAARGLDHLLGAAATTGRPWEALPSAALLGTHTLAVTAVSRRETQGGSALAPLAALTATAVLTRLVARGTQGVKDATSNGTGARSGVRSGIRSGASSGARTGASSGARIGTRVDVRRGAGVDAGIGVRIGVRSGVTSGARIGIRVDARRGAGVDAGSGARIGVRSDTGVDARTGASVGSGTATGIGTATGTGRRRSAHDRAGLTLDGALRTALATAYAATAGRPYAHAALNPSPPLTQRAVGGGIRAMIPLQAALAARVGGGVTALVIAALAPIGRKYARKVSIT